MTCAAVANEMYSTWGAAQSWQRKYVATIQELGFTKFTKGKVSRVTSTTRSGTHVGLSTEMPSRSSDPRSFGRDCGVTHACSDSGWAGCLQARKSMSGGVLLVGQCKTKHWSTTLKSIALSPAEPELTAVARFQ